MTESVLDARGAYLVPGDLLNALVRLADELTAGATFEGGEAIVDADRIASLDALVNAIVRSVGANESPQ